MTKENTPAAASQAQAGDAPMIAHTTPADGNIFADLGFPPEQAVRLLAESNAKIAESKRLRDSHIAGDYESRCAMLRKAYALHAGGSLSDEAIDYLKGVLGFSGPSHWTGRLCTECGQGPMVQDARDTLISHNGQEVLVRRLHADFCDACGDYVLDEAELMRLDVLLPPGSN